MQPVRFLPALTLGALVIVALAACSSGQTAGWTYAPPPSPSVAPSTAPSASAGASSAPSSAAPSASVAPSAAPSASADASVAPSAEASSGATVLTEVAKDIKFQSATLEAPAGQPFQIAFDNQDASVPHNIDIADASGASVFDGDLVTGVSQMTYNVGALAAGTYKFTCKVHPTVMIGELTVK